MYIKNINYKESIDFLLPRHYSGRKPNIMYSFGWFAENKKIVAVCTFGKPASPYLCKGICGEKFSKNVIELNRLCRIEALSEPISKFVSNCLRNLKKHDKIVVSYSDTDMNHNGYIYQACNFIYTGATKKRTDKYTEGNKHPRHYNNNNQQGKRKVRSPKHRYIYFCSSSKKLKKEWESNLKYKKCEYPKGKNSNYLLGEYLKPKIILNGDLCCR